MDSTVLYIVHSPPDAKLDWGSDGSQFGIDKKPLHIAKIAKAIKFAIRNIRIDRADNRRHEEVAGSTFIRRRKTQRRESFSRSNSRN